MISPRRLAAVLILCPLAAVAAARAELVLLTGGEVLKVAAYEAGEKTARLTLPGGGTMTLPILRVDRVLDDEVVPETEPPPAPPPLAALPLGFDPSQEVPDVPFGAWIYAAARDHAVNPQLVAAIVRAESAFDAGAVSHKGACGLMQLMPATARRFGLGRREVFDPRKNIAAGTRYLAWLIDHFDADLPRVLAAYNAGERAVERYGGVPPYRETRGYIQRIYSVLGLTLADASSLAPRRTPTASAAR